MILTKNGDRKEIIFSYKTEIIIMSLCKNVMLLESIRLKLLTMTNKIQKFPSHFPLVVSAFIMNVILVYLVINYFNSRRLYVTLSKNGIVAKLCLEHYALNVIT